MEGLFHSLTTARTGPESDANTRIFVGDGTPILKCPGLLTLSAVRVGTLQLPFMERRRFPMDTSFQNYHEENTPLLKVDVDPADGTPIVLRAKTSNDGIWQKGAQIFVTGDWESEAFGSGEAITSLSPKRCQAKVQGGHQCKNDALDGSDYCSEPKHQAQGKP